MATTVKQATSMNRSHAAPLRDGDAINLRLEDIREQVKALIECGELKPGERVNERALAAQLGVGRTAAREALRSLERTGLVRIIPNRGAEVCKITLEEALDLYDLRCGLARVAGRLVAARLSPSDEAALEDLLQRMQQALQDRDGTGYASLNNEFHLRLIAATKNPRLIEMHNAVESELKLYLRKGVYTNVQMQRSCEEHKRMLDAVRNGRVTEAAEAFENHIQAGKQRMLDTLTHTDR